MQTGAEVPVGLAGLHYPITQVSLAVRDLDSTMALYQRTFGWAPWQVFDHVLPVHHNTQLRGQAVHYALRGAEVYVGELNFELLQPLEGPNLWSEFIDRRGEGIASIATMFHERADGDAVKAAFAERFGANVSMKADIGDHIEYYYLDTEPTFGCLIESGSGHAIDFVRPAQVYPRPGAEWTPSPKSGIRFPISSVSLVVGQLDGRRGAFADAFGWGPWRTSEGAQGRFARAPVGQLTFELVEPGDSGPWRAALEESGDGLFGIGCRLSGKDELDRARTQFAELHVDVLAHGSDDDIGDWLLLDSQRDFKCAVRLEAGLHS
jgi:methylmalonyl-CoA/ethylmalonyl-CoA epimerase